MPPQSSQQILQRLRQQREGQPSLIQEGERLEQEAGLGERRASQQQIRESILGTQRLLKDVPKNVSARTRRLGGPVTQFALSRLTTAAQNPLTRQLGELAQSEQVGEAGIRGSLEDVGRRLGLIQAQRGAETEGLVRELDVALEGERAERERQARLEQIRAQQAIQFAQLQAEREAEERRQAFLRSLQGTGETNTGLGSAASLGLTTETGASAPISFGERVVRGLGGLGQFLGTAGGLIPTGTGETALSASIFGTDRLKEATQQRQAQNIRTQNRVNEFLAANPQFRGQVRTIGDVIRLQQAGVPLNTF